jgi:predicted RNA-binding protein with PUA-like domain
MARKPEAESRKKGDRRSKTAVKKAAGSRKPEARKPKARKPKARKKGPRASGLRLPAAVPKTAPYSEGKWAESFTRAPGERRYWLVKSEPSVFSFDDLLRAPGRTTYWDGVRNFAARNFLRDGMRLGDRVFFYHSMADPQHIAGICEVVRESYPDFTALDPRHEHFDPESNPDAPQWYMVDLRAVAQFTKPVTLPEIKARKELAEMALLRIGRLSVTPVREREWNVIVGLAG